LLRALELLAIRFDHGLGRQVFGLGLSQLGAKDGRERRSALDRRAELRMQLGDDPPDNREDFHFPVGIGHDGPRHLDRHAGFDDRHLRRFDPRLGHRFRGQDDLHVAGRCSGDLFLRP
jgi:hypothetical protein